jgi:serine/threonine-protein kinase
MTERLFVDRYELVAELASGGMATVYVGRVRGAVGFSRTVAIKRLHPQFARDPDFVAMFLDEARLASRIRHPNVVPTLDVVTSAGELFVVMEYVLGETLSSIARTLRASGEPMPLPIAASIASGMLLGLHAAHETVDEGGRPLDIVHRDVSPQNVIVGADGIARLVDFGIAKAAGRLQSTTDGAVKGKVGYMSPEQLEGHVDRRCDLYATAVVLWEMLTARRLFQGESQAHVVTKVLAGNIPSLRSLADVPLALDEVVMCGLELSPDRRFSTAREMERALRRAAPIAPEFDVAEWLNGVMGASLRERAAELSRIEATSAAARTAAAATPTSLGGVESRASLGLPATLAEPEATTEAPTTRPAWPLRGWRPASVALGAAALAAMSASAAFVVGARQGMPTPGASSPVAPQLAPSPDPRSAEPSAPTSPDAEAPPDAAAPSASGVKRPIHPQASPRPSHTPCNPPYYVDAHGLKKFRPECL